MMAFGRKKQPNAQDSKRPSVIEERDANKPAPPEQAPALGEPKISENNVAIVEYKFGIANRLTESVASKVVSLQKRSPDLVPLSKEFEGMRKGLRQMISSAKKFQESMIEMDKNRLQVISLAGI